MKKLFLGLLLILGIGFINFGSCFNLSSEQVNFLDNYSVSSGQNISQAGYVLLYDMGTENNSNTYNYCVVFKNFSRSSDSAWKIFFTSTLGYSNSNNAYYGMTSPYSVFCTSGRRRYILLAGGSSLTFSFDKYRVISPEVLFSVILDLSSVQSSLSTCQSSLSSCESDYSSCSSDLSNCQNSSCSSELLQCQNDYSSCSSSLGTCGTSLNSCQNALGNCMQGQVGTGVNWSSLFINGIQHIGKPLINITIPEEISRDYVNSDNSFDLDIEGYNVNTEYISGIIEGQTTLPNETDFNNIISGVLPLFIPGLVIILFIYFVFRFVKKIF